MGKACILKFGLLLLFALAVFARVWEVGNIPGINGDEAWWGEKAVLIAQGQAVSWRTNSGNFMSPLYALPLVLFHKLLPISSELLRAVAVSSGLLALLLNFGLCRHCFDRLTAIVSTTLLAVLPCVIMSGRIGWESSQSILATIPVVYAAVWLAIAKEKVWIAAAVTGGALFCALTMHPVHFFLGAFPLVALAVRGATRLEEKEQRLGLVLGLVVSFFILVAASLAIAPPWLREAVLHRLSQFPWSGDWLPACVSFLRLFSGIASFQYYAGSFGGTSVGAWPAFTVWDGIVLLLFVVAVAVILRWGKSSFSFVTQDRCLLGGAFIAILLFFVHSGPARMEPNVERYILWMIVPGALLLARGFALGWIQFPQVRNALALAGALTCVGCLALYFSQYLFFIKHTGGESHFIYRTNAQDPKWEAALWLNGVESKGELLVASHDWFVHWPMLYAGLSASDSTRVNHLLLKYGKTAQQNTQDKKRIQLAQQRGQLVYAEFPTSPDCLRLRNELNIGSANSQFQEKVFLDYGQRPVLILFVPKPQ